MSSTLWLVLGILGCKPASTVVTDPPQPTDTDTDQPGPRTSWSTPLIQDLRDGVEGMEWREALFHAFTAEDCPEVIDALGYCLGLNPVSPYYTFLFEEDAHLDAPVGVFQLDQDEAVVFIGEAPPVGRYFNLLNHVYSKDYDGERKLVVSQISPSLHQRTLAHAGPVGDEAWGQFAAVIWSANATTTSRVQEALETRFEMAGLPIRAITTQPIPSLSDGDRATLAADPAYHGIPLVPIDMGYTPTADDFTVILRMAGMPEDHPYLDPLQVPATAFKVRLTDPTGYDPVEYPILPPPRDPDGPPTSLRDSLDRVVDAVRDDILAAGLERARLPFGTNDFSGYRCIEVGVACGANDDALYRNSGSTLLPPESTGGVFAIGVVHNDVPAVYPNAPSLAYSSLTVRNENQRMGVVAKWDHELRGSARARYPTGVHGVSDADLDLMYIWEFARDCGTREQCSVVGPGDLEVPDGHQFNLGERAYLDHRTDTGPAASAIVRPWTLWYGEDVRIQLLNERIYIP